MLRNTNCLSTLFFEMNFDGKNVGKATLEKNECFDMCIQLGIPTGGFL